MFSAGVTVSIKRLTRTESPLTIMLWSYIIMGSATTLVTLMTWRTPSLTEMILVCGSALFSAWGQSCLVYGLRAGEASVVTPFEYTRLLYAGILGYFLFDELPASSTWLGGAVIIGATLYIGIREARLASRARAAK
jgi:drug/metabolite transporter (DMT)-like permease